MKKIANIILQFLAVMALMTVFVHVSALAASPYLPLDPADTVKGIYKEAAIPVPETSSGSIDSDAVMNQIIMSGLGYVKVITVVIGILYITIMGAQMVMASGNEEQISSVKRGMIYILIAFCMISMSQEIAKIFDFGQTTLLQNPQAILRRVQLFDKQVQIFITFVKYVLTGYAGVLVVRAAAKLITAGGEEETVSKYRKSLLYKVGALLLVYVGDVFINKVFYVVDKSSYTATSGIKYGVDVGQGVKELAGITNLVVSFVGPVAVLMVIIAAIMYLTAAGKEESMEKAKKLLVAVVVGIVIIYGSFAIVSTIIAGSLPAETTTADTSNAAAQILLT